MASANGLNTSHRTLGAAEPDRLFLPRLFLPRFCCVDGEAVEQSPLRFLPRIVSDGEPPRLSLCLRNGFFKNYVTNNRVIYASSSACHFKSSSLRHFYGTLFDS